MIAEYLADFAVLCRNLSVKESFILLFLHKPPMLAVERQTGQFNKAGGDGGGSRGDFAVFVQAFMRFVLPAY